MSVSDLRDAFLALRKALPDEARLYVGGGSGAPDALADLLAQDPELAAGITFVGAWIPGMNATDWASLHPEARAETTFITDAWRASFEAGRTRFLPLSYSQTWRWLSSTPLDAAVLVTSPPDSHGNVSLGVSPDFGPALAARKNCRILALTNPSMPQPVHAPEIPENRITLMARIEQPLPGSESLRKPDPVAVRIGNRVAGLINDGDTLQFGIGAIPSSVLAGLHQHKNLRLHSGMITDDVLDLADADALSRKDASIVTGIAFGSRRLYEDASADQRYAFRPVSVTHNAAEMSKLQRFIAINSAVEIDLLGQVNAEHVGAKRVSGPGGLPDFLTGAALARDGRGIIALPSTARGGKASRIVPRLDPGRVTLSRYQTDTIVTEHGIAELRGLELDERAEALIAIADPAFRPELEHAWDDMRRNGVS